MPKWTEEEHKFARELQKSLNKKEEGLPTKAAPLSASRQNSSSNDIGDVTWVVPSATVRFPSAVPGVQAHHWTAGIAPTMSIAHKGAVVGAKVMAASVLDLLTSPELLAAAKKQFNRTPKTRIFFATAAGRDTAGGFKQGNNGQVSSGDAQVLSNQESPV